jgi:hypothetical protein
MKVGSWLFTFGVDGYRHRLERACVMMKSEIGNPTFPLWLLGDSEPARWRDKLDEPFDKRHPIRHNIWTSITDVIQHDVFAALGRRVATEEMFVRNAVQDPGTKPKDDLFNAERSWPAEAEASLGDYRRLLAAHRPKLVISFGVFAFAFALRALNETCGSWACAGSESAILGCEFRKRASNFDPTRTNVLPLLHRSIAGGHFLAGHDQFTGVEGANYFESAGTAIATLLVRHHTDLDCWVRRPGEGGTAVGPVPVHGRKALTGRELKQEAHQIAPPP